MERNIQIEIGQEGEVVTIPLKEYENLLKEHKHLKEVLDRLTHMVFIPHQEYERLIEIEFRMKGLEK